MNELEGERRQSSKQLDVLRAPVSGYQRTAYQSPTNCTRRPEHQRTVGERAEKILISKLNRVSEIARILSEDRGSVPFGRRGCQGVPHPSAAPQGKAKPTCSRPLAPFFLVCI